jgi:hypothetical protein
MLTCVDAVVRAVDESCMAFLQKRAKSRDTAAIPETLPVVQSIHTPDRTFRNLRMLPLGAAKEAVADFVP